jgi:heat shock protein HslJ
MHWGRCAALGAAVVVWLAGCGGHRVQTVGDGGDRVTASVTYREPEPLPDDAELELWIADGSSTPSAASLVAHGTVPMRGRDTVVALRYDGRRIDDDHTYLLKGALKSGGRTIYQTDADTLVITRGHSRNATLVLRPVVEERPAPIAAESARPVAPVLAGTTWRLENLAGAPVLEGIDATLEFLDQNRVAGRASCNTFTGELKISDAAIKIGPLVSTRMACQSEAATAQEAAYLTALNEAERFTLEGATLQIFSQGQANPLRFVRRP